MKLRLSPILLLLANSKVLAGASDRSSETATVTVTAFHPSGNVEHAFFNDDNSAAQNPMQVGAMPPNEQPRQRHEKAHLAKRMNRKNGKWGTTHPRYRLLESLFGFCRYREQSLAELSRWKDMYGNVKPEQKQLLEKTVRYKQKLEDMEELVYENDIICKEIVANAMKFYGIEQKELDEHIKDASKSGRKGDRISVTQTLKHFVRDWADEGAKERNDAFPCILNTMENLKTASASEKPLKVLLPGSGVGRLGHDVANLGGFEVTVNEWSMYMNVGYRYINSRSKDQTFAVHPFIDGMSHHATTSDLLRKVTAPNMSPNPSVLLVEGDFTTIFDEQEGHFDIIVTHFFIDTARNLMSYFDTINRLLKKGGRWVNLGPLLYGTGPYVQLSLDEIVVVVEELGFEFEDLSDECGELTFEGKKIRSKEAEYGFNGKALTRHAYKAQVWVAKKT